MKQLKMLHNSGSIARDIIFPEGYYMRSYQPNSGDGKGWCKCCIDGGLGIDKICEDLFTEKMLKDEKVNHSNIFFLISPTGEVAGTVTYMYGKEENEGIIHMVGIQKDYLGKRLSLPMLLYAMQKMLDDGRVNIYLTTDDWRVPAIKIYFQAGFEPVYYADDMQERWGKVLEAINETPN